MLCVSVCVSVDGENYVSFNFKSSYGTMHMAFNDFMLDDMCTMKVVDIEHMSFKLTP